MLKGRKKKGVKLSAGTILVAAITWPTRQEAPKAIPFFDLQFTVYSHIQNLSGFFSYSTLRWVSVLNPNFAVKIINNIWN